MTQHPIKLFSLPKDRPIRVALAGNPNVGKTSLFNALTGSHYKVGNYPGVTVEKREGLCTFNGRQYCFIDLPGIYSLSAYSIDEVVARDFLLDERPDIVVDVLDSTNLERNLFLLLQFQELNIPVVAALNMTDEASTKGIKIDVPNLSSLLGVAMVTTVSIKGNGIESLIDAIDYTLMRPLACNKMIHYGDEIESRIKPLERSLMMDPRFGARYPARWLAIKLIEKDAHAFERLKEHKKQEEIAEKSRNSSVWLERHSGKDASYIVSERRYGYIHGAVKEAVQYPTTARKTLTEMIDIVVMNRFLSLPLFILVLAGVFQLTFTVGGFPQQWLEHFFTWLSGAVASVLPNGMIKSLVVDGIIAGIGSVFSFVPLIIILFFLLSWLEDVGYMSRAAFATDQLLHTFGLHGQSVFPLMIGFGCSVPAIMAARALKSPKDRILTILVTPFMSCGAKLPVYVCLAGAFFPQHASLAVMSMYAIGVMLSLITAVVLKHTILKGTPTPFVMELPPYRAPTLSGTLWHVWDKTSSYLRKMATVIMGASILIWLVTTFPHYSLTTAEQETARLSYTAQFPSTSGEKAQQYVEAVQSQKAMEKSVAGWIGHTLEPVFRPMGFDWKVCIAMVTGFAAKEVIISTMGILYRPSLDSNGATAMSPATSAKPLVWESSSHSLREVLRYSPGWNPLVGFNVMLFTLVIPPCITSLVTIKNELGYKWLWFEVAFLFALGWTLCTLVFQLGVLLGWGPH